MNTPRPSRAPRLSATARRRSPLPANWAQLKRRIFARDGHHCRIDKLGQPPCPSAHRLELHHLGADHDHRDHMLLTLCRTHHATITGRDARAVQLRGRRTPGPHPGLRFPTRNDSTTNSNANAMNSENASEKDSKRGLT